MEVVSAAVRDAACCSLVVTTGFTSVKGGGGGKISGDKRTVVRLGTSPPPPAAPGTQAGAVRRWRSTRLASRKDGLSVGGATNCCLTGLPTARVVGAPTIRSRAVASRCRWTSLLSLRTDPARSAPGECGALPGPAMAMGRAIGGRTRRTSFGCAGPRCGVATGLPLPSLVVLTTLMSGPSCVTLTDDER